MKSENPIFRFARGETGPNQGGMSRREMVRQLLSGVGGTAAAASLAGAKPLPLRAQPSSAAQAQGAAAPAAASEWSPQFLDAHQNETLVALAERVVPGSSQAQVNRMIDLLLTVDTQSNQRKFLESLSAFEAEALQQHRQPFASLSEEQQVDMLTAASTAKSSKKQAGSESEAVSWFGPLGPAEEEAPMTIRDHFENIKDWAVKSYYSSEVGLKDIGWTGQVMWESFPSCEHPDEHK